MGCSSPVLRKPCTGKIWVSSLSPYLKTGDTLLYCLPYRGAVSIQQEHEYKSIYFLKAMKATQINIVTVCSESNTVRPIL